MSDFPPTISALDVQRALYGVDVARVTPIDSAYALPARDWLAYLRRELPMWRRSQLGDAQYRPQNDDCDDFALDAHTFARIRHRCTRQDAAGIAFGCVAYTTEQGGGHAINVAVCREAGALVVVFWEPQTGREVELTEYERSTACVLI